MNIYIVISPIFIFNTILYYIQSVPRVATAVTLGPCPRPWRGVVTAPQHTANFPLRDYATQKRGPWNGEGEGERTRTGTRDAKAAARTAGSSGAGARGATTKTLFR